MNIFSWMSLDYLAGLTKTKYNLIAAMRALIIKSSEQTNEMFELHWFEKKNGYKNFVTKISINFFPNGTKMEIDKLHSKILLKKFWVGVVC